LKASPTDDL